MSIGGSAPIPSVVLLHEALRQLQEYETALLSDEERLRRLKYGKERLETEKRELQTKLINDRSKELMIEQKRSVDSSASFQELDVAATLMKELDACRKKENKLRNELVKTRQELTIARAQLIPHTHKAAPAPRTPDPPQTRADDGALFEEELWTPVPTPTL
ncbi:Chromosome partition protein Smc [Carpediemonas membranifera]|uniref:Chromosome partition protein Smc n=1 Tax=Carpediemonas membranifera TaxID=201153 RepID=A0A8J6BWB9_9EUKA|nr:Chromosome partition protein Smc [Carpediemonas membranifera]|eukprot:KAG9392286.1 Chromosome partition protein Smc [Carpediemonas membranifera]